MRIGAAIGRYFRLRRSARQLDIPVRWYWGNERLLQALFEARCQKQVEFALTKRAVILDFRSYKEAQCRTPQAK